MKAIIKILGGLAVVFLMFLPVAGCERTNEYNVYGYKMLRDIFKSGEIDTTWVLFFLSVACGITIIFLRKYLLPIIFATAGIIFFFAAYIYVKSKQGMDIVELKIGAFLAIFAFIAVIVMSIIKMATGNKQAVITPVQQPQYPPPPQYTQQQQYVPPPPPPPAQQQQFRPKFCTKCGNKFPENYQGKFCTQCGAKI